MAATAIMVPLDADTAAVYNTASQEDQHRIQQLVRLVVREFATASPQTLRDLMDDIGSKAMQRGLTPALLEQLLHDDD